MITAPEESRDATHESTPPRVSEPEGDAGAAQRAGPAGPGPASGPPADGRVDGRRYYHPELDGIRFLAFLMVYMFHGGLRPILQMIDLVNILAIDPLLAIAGDPVGWGGWALDRFAENGWVGVQLFFVLSGFLITTLLLREEDRYRRIDLRAFWVRRILRIWPLYYLLIVIGFVILPAIQGKLLGADYWGGAGAQLPAFLAFLGNWAIIANGMIVGDVIGVLWSVCVEEQFYIFVPLLLVWVPRWGRIPVVLALMGVAIGYRHRLAVLDVEQIDLQFHTLAQLDTLLCGVLMALAFHARPPGERAARAAKYLQVPLALAVIYLLTRNNLGHVDVSRRTWDFVGIYLAGAGLIAVAVVHDGAWKRFLSGRRIVYLGRISYGLYMFHEIGLMLGGYIGPSLVRWSPDRGLGTLLVEAVMLGATIGLAALSYAYWERPFLKLKSRFTRVRSRPV